MPLKIKASYLHVAQTKALISWATTVQSSDLHLCFHICKRRFSHEAAHLKSVYLAHTKVWFCSLFAYAKSLSSHDTASIKPVNLAQKGIDQLREYHVSAPLFMFVQKHVFSSFGSYKVFLLSTNKGADQVRDYRATDLHLCFGIDKSRVSDQVRHKPGCTATEDGQRLEISE